MGQNPIRSLKRAWQLLLFRRSAISLFAVVLLLTGCSARKRPNIPWATAVHVKPVLQASAPSPNLVPELDAPELKPQAPPLAVLLLPVRPGPPRPRGAPTTTNSGSDPEKSAAPVIAPQLSPQEAAAAEQETNQSLRIAEKNLAVTRGKALNASQSDLVSKIKGFLKDAREAVQAGDWSQARGLAKKAEVLSQELVGSF